MGIFDELYAARHQLIASGRKPDLWRFSPEGWDKVRAEADPAGNLLGLDGSRALTVIGIPYSVTCDLPPDTDFVLEDEHQSRIRANAKRYEAKGNTHAADKLKALASEVDSMRERE